MSNKPTNNIQLLQASVDQEDDSHFRLLFNAKHIKYITIAAGIYEDDDMCFAPSLLSILPPFPEGHWNDGYIIKHPESGEPYFQRAVWTSFPGVQSTWHDKSFEYLHLKLGTKLRTNVYEATIPGASTLAVAKFARFDWEIAQIDQECAAYGWIEGKAIGPKFLGNITEEGRVIGFVVEHVAGARHASSADHAACKEVLSRLHQLGIVHGDINKHNFLIVGNRATLVDFDGAHRTTDKRALETEMQLLETQLADMSGRGGISRTVE